MRELLETYPKATEVVKSYYLEKLLQSLEGRGLPDEFKDHVKQQGISNDMLEKLLIDGPRNLFDVFDENNIYIDIDIHVYVNGISDNVKFSFKLPGWDIMEIEYVTRKEAEQAAIEEAFELLEKKL
jgi:hypothetical protein